MGNLLPCVGMVIVILAQVGNMVMIKAALSREINTYVMILYSNMLSTLIVFPCAFIFHRSPHFPLTSSVLCRIFLLALVGLVCQTCRYIGLAYSSPTLDTAMLNLVPAFAFLLAVTFRMEKLDWRSRSSQAKIIGTLISIAGAFVVTFYNGPTIIRTQSLTAPTHLLVFSPRLKWIIGALLLAIQAFMLAVWYTLQAMVLKLYPVILIVLFYCNAFSTITSAVYSLIMVEDMNAWMLKIDMGLISVFYSALVGNILIGALSSWCLSNTGPLFVSMFKPLGIVFAIGIGVLFSGDALCFGSLIGTIIIVTGFYAVMWGKVKEEEKPVEDNGLVKKVPLLQNSIQDMNSL